MIREILPNCGGQGSIIRLFFGPRGLCALITTPAGARDVRVSEYNEEVEFAGLGKNDQNRTT